MLYRYRPRSRRRTVLERAAIVACVACGLSTALVWEGSPVEIVQADALALVLMVIAIVLSMIAWLRRGSQGSLSVFVLCLLGGALLGQALTYLVNYGTR